MTLDQFHAVRGLSHSAMKDLSVSALRYWHLHLNPNAPEREESPEMRFGSALHCRVLEPDKFEQRYARAISPADFDGCLITMDDLRGWLADRGMKAKGTRKSDLIAQVQAADPEARIFDVLFEQFHKENAGKTILNADQWDRVQGAAESLLSEPRIQEVIAEGEAEVPMLARDPEHNVLLKAIMDWVTPKYTLDIKTFSQRRGRTIDESVCDSIWFERYHWQGYFYGYVRSLQEGFPKPGRAALAPPFVLAFVESEAPHEVRIRVLQAEHGIGGPNMLWDDARKNVNGLIHLYAECMEHFGTEKPWRYAADVDVLQDGDVRQVLYA